MYKINEIEKKNQRINPKKLEKIKNTFELDGLVVVEDLISSDLLDTINGKLNNDAAHIIYNHYQIHNKYPHHLQLGLPRDSNWVFPEIACNPIIEEILVELLGGAVFMRYYNGNTSLPNGDFQKLHMDGGGWSIPNKLEAEKYDVDFPHPCFKLFVNIPTKNTNPENGSTEVWPGSHLITDIAEINDLQIESKSVKSLIEKMKTGYPPRQILTNKGSVIFRDLRLWHRGCPNFSNEPRHMLSIGFGAEKDPFPNCSHLGSGKHRQVFSLDSKDKFTDTKFSPYVDKLLYFIDDQVDHFGNVAPNSKYAQLNNSTGIVKSGPYANQSFDSRFKYSFFPQPLEGLKLKDLPKWCH
ncbi:MAG: phytanoyl-CoA dioxygenase family protein [SAR324 cluster bacterium]|nr:phytanoyl-CoA dioxygenase family protein [SAR324 cluster bacterium]